MGKSSARRDGSAMLQEKAYDRLLGWKTKSKGSPVLLVEGARRVGKATLVATPDIVGRFWPVRQGVEPAAKGFVREHQRIGV